MNCEFEDKIFELNRESFTQKALEVFRFQASGNLVYRSFLDALGTDVRSVTRLEDIPYLPVAFFKSAQIQTGSFEPEIIFESSGTTGSVNSRHHIKKLAMYRQSFRRAFEINYGKPSDWCIIGLLPSYLERDTSSLVYMVDDLISRSAHPSGGFYLYEHQKLSDTLTRLEKEGQKTLLIGVSFALLDFSEQHGKPLKHCIIMETGGMKGRRAEMTRPELHALLGSRFGQAEIHSEYGMTELLSQAYSKGNGLYSCPPWMRLLVRESDDPLTVTREGKGILNVIDLANLYSCSFIATDDIGLVHADSTFEVQGRVDHSDIRGCSLMVTDMRE